MGSNRRPWCAAYRHRRHCVVICAMCKYVRHWENRPRYPVPRVLQALMRLANKAESDYAQLQSRLDQVGDMEQILNKLVLTHIDSDNYVEYLFKRAEQLSQHLETFKKIIGKIDIGDEIRAEYKQISYQFVDYLRRKIEFKRVWIESMQTIESGRRTVQEKLILMDKFRDSVEIAYKLDKYFELDELKNQFEDELADMNDLIDHCFQCGKHAKELSSLLYAHLTELEASFQVVVKESVMKINEIKQAPLPPARAAQL